LRLAYSLNSRQEASKMAVPSEIMQAAKMIIEAYRDKSDIGPKLRDRLAQAAVELEKVTSELIDLESFISLDSSILGKGKQAATGMTIWEELSPGMHREPSELEQFINTSTLLNSLFKKGIDITKIYKFSPEEVQLARKVGDRFSDLSFGLREVRRGRDTEKQDEKSMLFKCTPDSGEVLRLLESNSIGSVERMRIKKDDKWKPFRMEWFRNNDSDAVVLTIFKVQDVAKFRFLQGEWLNAYVYNIISDHLRRNQATFELYTNVSYRAPADVIRVAGEFDVIGLVQNKFICVECKSGRIANEDSISSIGLKISDLRTAVDSVSREKMDFLFYLVFDPTQNDEQQIASLVAESGIRALRPDQVRPEIVKTFEL
jgi:hypothetical protein